MDVLSEVLKAVKLDGAMFYNAEFSAPWCFRSPASPIVAPYLSPDARHVILYHLLTEGRGYAQVEGDDRSVPLNAGDIVIFPHGDPHIMGNGSPVKPIDNEQELQRIYLKASRSRAWAEVGRSPNLSAATWPVSRNSAGSSLAGCHPVLKVSIRNDASGQWLEHSIRYSVGNTDASRPGGEAVLAKLSEVLFVETLRRSSRCSRGNKPGGWPVSATLKSGKPWPCCIASRPILGRLPRSRAR